MGGVNKEVSIFCNNCIGAFVAHDFRLPFNSPTVNLMIPPADYIDYISHMAEYTNAEMREVESEKEWPSCIAWRENTYPPNPLSLGSRWFRGMASS